MKIVTYFHLKEVKWAIPAAQLARLHAKFPRVELVSVQSADALPPALRDADAYFGWHFPRAHFGAAKRLRWVHSASAGVEEVLFEELRRSDVVLTNSAGLHSVSIPEHVLGQMLVLARNFHEAARLQARAEWNRMQLIVFGAGVRELNGSCLLVIGAGAIGTNLVRLAAALGMEVRVVRRDPSRPVAGATSVHGPAELLDRLRWADFVVLAAPATRETRGMIDAEALRAMKPTAYLINVGRGELVDEEALVDALRRGAIAGAGLDVFAAEPLPASHPLWSLPNAVITPHLSGYTPRYFDLVLELFEDNLERFVAGRPLRNVVDKDLGYARE